MTRPPETRGSDVGDAPATKTHRTDALVRSGGIPREHRPGVARPEKIRFFADSLRKHCLAPGKAQPPESCGCLMCFSARLLVKYTVHPEEHQPAPIGEPDAWLVTYPTGHRALHFTEKEARALQLQDGYGIQPLYTEAPSGDAALREVLRRLIEDHYDSSSMAPLSERMALWNTARTVVANAHLPPGDAALRVTKELVIKVCEEVSRQIPGISAYHTKAVLLAYAALAAPPDARTHLIGWMILPDPPRGTWYYRPNVVTAPPPSTDGFQVVPVYVPAFNAPPDAPSNGGKDGK